MHGDKSQRQRENALARFERGEVMTLVATDVAARGIDVPDVVRVFNYDAPEDQAAYVHRIGRTGRAGRTGTGISFVLADEVKEMRKIARDLGLEWDPPDRHGEAGAAPRGAAADREDARPRREDSRPRREGGRASRSHERWLQAAPRRGRSRSSASPARSGTRRRQGPARHRRPAAQTPPPSQAVSPARQADPATAVVAKPQRPDCEPGRLSRLR